MVVGACSTGADSGGSLFRSPLSTQTGTVDAGEAAALISAYRKSRGLPPVTVDPTLTRIAVAHAQRMASADKMAHVLPGEGSFQQRLAAGGFQPSMAAENVAAGQKSLADVLESWRKSPGHNANLLLPNVSRIGIALSIARDSRYKTYWSLVLGEWFVPGPGGGIAGGPGAGPLLFPTANGATLEIH
jgi:uncharacterized protein YkwD